ncbi:hypothetical protein [Scytonema sp. UIC 10036]|nr:hypothetical protein [Scytonema sp. UIC 10036]
MSDKLGTTCVLERSQSTLYAIQFIQDIIAFTKQPKNYEIF